MLTEMDTVVKLEYKRGVKLKGAPERAVNYFTEACA